MEFLNVFDQTNHVGEPSSRLTDAALAIQNRIVKHQDLPRFLGGKPVYTAYESYDITEEEGEGHYWIVNFEERGDVEGSVWVHGDPFPEVDARVEDVPERAGVEICRGRVDDDWSVRDRYFEVNE